MFPRAAVFQSATPADRTSYRSSLGVVRARAARACVLEWQDAPRKACARAGLARRAAKKKKEKVPAKKGQRTKVQDTKESCVRAVRLGSAIAAASPILCEEREQLETCVEEATAGACAAKTRACASRSGRVSGGVWQYKRGWPVAPS